MGTLGVADGKFARSPGKLEVRLTSQEVRSRNLALRDTNVGLATGSVALLETNVGRRLG